MERWHITLQGPHQDEVVEGYKSGWEIEAPVIEMAHYLPWLMERFLMLGGDFQEGFISSLSDVEGELVVNCTGLGARELCDDEEVVPVRGQIIYIEQDPGFGRFDQRPENLIYTIPRRDVTVLGGTAQKGDWHGGLGKATRKRYSRSAQCFGPNSIGAK